VTLPDPVRRFTYGANELGRFSHRTGWGIIIADPRYPRIWDANNAAVLEPDPDLTAEQIRAELDPVVRGAGAPTEHVEIWETAVENPALRTLRDERISRVPDVAMVFDGDADALPDQVDLRVEELPDLDAALWRWYRTTLNEFGDPLDDDVLDQLVSRIREVFLPSGLRWFLVRLDGEPAGYTSLISVAGVGYLDSVVTMPKFRRRGIASATVGAAVRASAEAGNRATFLLAEEGGEPQRLYERLGFVTTARIESFTRPLPIG